jgi:hypothetical protein
MTLLGEYKAATAAHASAVSELHKKIGVCSSMTTMYSGAGPKTPDAKTPLLSMH